MDILLFQLTAPLASWGAPAVGECRPTERRPSHSALVGLCAAALGIPKTDDRQPVLARGYAFATRADRAPAGVLTDFHTAFTGRGAFRTRAEQLAAGSRTVLSWRDYLQDVAFTVAMIERPDAIASLLDVATALHAPTFPLFAGRKACPLSAPPNPLVMSAASLDEAFAAYDEARKGGPVEGGDGVIACDDAFIDLGLVDASRVDHVVDRRDMPLSRLPQRFAMRREHFLHDAVRISSQ